MDQKRRKELKNCKQKHKRKLRYKKIWNDLHSIKVFEHKVRRKGKGKSLLNTLLFRSSKGHDIYLWKNNKFLFPGVVDLFVEGFSHQLLKSYANFLMKKKKKKKIIFNFCLTHTISVAGGIFIRMLFDYYKDLGHSIKIKCFGFDWSLKTRQVLSYIGLLPKQDINYRDIDRWNIHSWETHDFVSQGIVSEIVNKLTGWDKHTLEHQNLYISIPELLFNASEHAYPEDKYDKSFKKFYLFWGLIKEDEQNASYVFCILDKGIGFKERFLSLNANLLNIWSTDKEFIHAAIKEGYSALRKESKGRGNGLPAVHENIAQLNGRLYIHSGAGSVDWEAGEKEGKKLDRTALPGSLVILEVPIQKKNLH